MPAFPYSEYAVKTGTSYFSQLSFATDSGANLSIMSPEVFARLCPFDRITKLANTWNFDLNEVSREHLGSTSW